MKIQLRVPTQNPDRRKQLSGVAPNFVHSMDAYHLRMVVNRMVDEGVTTSFAMIHDSFGVHAGDVDELHHVIRDEFINLYTPDVLAEFVDDLSIVCPDADWPAVPDAGDLDLEEVRDADFFFS
jgi:DNA-directed RNA polymerase, mitochondrial